MNTALWIVQGILAAIFTLGGLAKMFQPKEALLDKMPWTADYSSGMIKFIGFVELLGVAALILPPLLGQFTMLTPIAAIALGIVMILAANLHINRGESDMIVVNATIALFCAFVAYGRWGWV